MNAQIYSAASSFFSPQHLSPVYQSIPRSFLSPSLYTLTWPSGCVAAIRLSDVCVLHTFTWPVSHLGLDILSQVRRERDTRLEEWLGMR